MNDSKNNSKTNKKQKYVRQANVLEALKDIGGGAGNSLKNDVLKSSSQEIWQQLFAHRARQKFSGELQPGQDLEMGKVMSGEQAKLDDEQKKKDHEMHLSRAEATLVERRGQELKFELQTLRQEVIALAQATSEIDEEVQIAAFEAPVNPGIYHIVFFEKLIEFIKSFRKKIKDASVWLASANKRAQKKDYWSRYKQHKGKFLLAPDHYLTRSAG